jgi:chromosome segregation ATPase
MGEEQKPKVTSWFKNLLFEQEPEKPQQEAQPETTTPVNVQPQQKAEIPPTRTEVKSAPDSKVQESLLEVLAKKDLQGFDYFEFKNSVENLASVIPDEATRYKSAYAIASTMNIKIEDLLKTADYYISVLREEEKKFTAVLAAKSKEVIANETKLTQFDTQIAQKAEQIKSLTKEIEDFQAQKAKLAQEIIDFKSTIDQLGSEFKTTLEFLVARINEDKQKITMYIR